MKRRCQGAAASACRSTSRGWGSSPSPGPSARHVRAELQDWRRGRPLDAQGDRIELLLALTPEAVAQHWPELRSGGGIIYDEGLKLPRAEGELKERGIQLL